MNIVGINISHDSSSCLLRDGKLVYLLEEERISRRKAHGIHYGDLRFYGLEHLKNHVKVIDHLVFSSYGRGGKAVNDAETIFTYIEDIDHYGGEYFSRRWDTMMNEGKFYRAIPDVIEFFLDNDRVVIHAIVKQLTDVGIKVKNIVFEPDQHHLHHAIAGYHFSNFDQAVSLVMDAGGSFGMDDYYEMSKFLKYQAIFREKESAYYFTDKEMRSIYGHFSRPFTTPREGELMLKRDGRVFSHTLSAGDLFNLITGDRFLGMGCGKNAGKTMGLSSYYQDEFPEELQEDWFYELDGVMLTDHKLLDKLESLNSKYDFKVRHDNMYYPSMLAKKLQIETEKLTIFLIKKALEITPTKNVILSGGYFMNCVNNFKYRKYFSDDIKFYIDPIPYEAGTCFGCAAQVWMGFTGKKVKVPDNLYLGS